MSFIGGMTGISAGLILRIFVRIFGLDVKRKQWN